MHCINNLPKEYYHQYHQVQVDYASFSDSQQKHALNYINPLDRNPLMLTQNLLASWFDYKTITCQKSK